MTDNGLSARLERAIFEHRVLLIAVFALITVAMLVLIGRGLRIDASFTKQLPLKHEYMQTFVEYQAEFGGANRVLIALIARDGNMFTGEFFDALKKATNEVLVMDGSDRGRRCSRRSGRRGYREPGQPPRPAPGESGQGGPGVQPSDGGGPGCCRRRSPKTRPRR